MSFDALPYADLRIRPGWRSSLQTPNTNDAIYSADCVCPRHFTGWNEGLRIPVPLQYNYDIYSE